MLLYAEPGSEYLVAWVKAKLPAWHRAMIDSNMVTQSRTVQVSTGVTIYAHMERLLDGTFRDRVRITGGVADLRALAWLGGSPTSATSEGFPFIAAASPAPPYHRQFLDPAFSWRNTWSKDGSTFVAIKVDAVSAFGQGSALVRRGGVETSVTGVVPFFDMRGFQPPSSSWYSDDLSHAPAGNNRGHFRFLDAPVSSDGKTIVFCSSIEGEACVVLRWNGSSYDQTRVSYPSQVTDYITGASAGAYTGRAKSYTSPDYTVPNTGPGVSNPFVGSGMIGTTLGNPYDASEVLLAFSYEKITSGAVAATSGTTVTIYRGVGLSCNFILRYDTLVGTWSVLHDDERVFYRYLTGSGVASVTWTGDWYGGSVRAVVAETTVPRFEPAGGVALSYAAYDLTTAPDAESGDLVDSDVLTTKASVTLRRNGTDWVTSIAATGGTVRAPDALIDQTETTTIHVPQLAREGRMLVMTYAGAAIWKHGIGAADQMGLASVPGDVSLSASGRQLLMQDTTYGWVLYADGTAKWQASLDANSAWFVGIEVVKYASFDTTRWVGPVNSVHRPFRFAADTAAGAPNPYKLVLDTAFAATATAYDMAVDGTEPGPSAGSAPSAADLAAYVASNDFGITLTQFAADAAVTEAAVIAAAQNYLDGTHTPYEDQYIDVFVVESGEPDYATLLVDVGMTDAQFRAFVDANIDADIAALTSAPSTGVSAIATTYFVPRECVGN